MIQPKHESKQTYVDITKLVIDNYAELNPLNNDVSDLTSKKHFPLFLQVPVAQVPPVPQKQ